MFPNTVGVQTLGLSWQLKWSRDGRHADTQVGWSGTKVYRTAAAPATATLYETLLHLGCNSASGLSGDDPQALVDAIWAEFADRDVRRVDGVRMGYWLTNFPMQEARLLLASAGGDGSCRAWGELLVQTLRAQGIADPVLVQIRTTHLNQSAWGLLPEQQQGMPGLMLVRHWNFVGPGSAPAQACPAFPYRLSPPTVPAEVSPGPRVPAQGNNDSPDGFFNHYIVRRGATFYDPSYGNGPFASLADEENAAFAGFAVGCATNANEIVLVAKRNHVNDPEIQIVP